VIYNATSHKLLGITGNGDSDSGIEGVSQCYYFGRL
jgi:hypothetical protein